MVLEILLWVGHVRFCTNSMALLGFHLVGRDSTLIKRF